MPVLEKCLPILKPLKDCIPKISRIANLLVRSDLSVYRGNFGPAWSPGSAIMGKLSAATQGKLLPDMGRGVDNEGRRAFGRVVFR